MTTEASTRSLHPDLADYLNTMRETNVFDGMKCIQHPLVYSVPFMGSDFEIDHLNKYYIQKRNQLELAEMNKDAERYVFLHERPWRLYAFTEAVGQDMVIPESTGFWKLLHRVWIDSENIWQNIDTWAHYFSFERGYDFMDGKDRRALLQLFRDTDEITIYRGGDYDGLSYTICEEKALWFSRRFSPSSTGNIITRKVRCSEIFAYTDQRNEQEVILKNVPQS